MIATFAQLLAQIGQVRDCNVKASFFGIPSWHEHLLKTQDTLKNPDGSLKQYLDTCSVTFNGIDDLFLVMAAVVEITLRLAAFLAIAFIIYGGVMFILSQGNPDRITTARNILINSVIGLIFAIFASALVSFIAGRF